MSRMSLTLLSVCVLVCFAGAPRAAYSESHGPGTALADPRTGLLTPAQRERLLEACEERRNDPQSVCLLPENCKPDDTTLIFASMCHGPRNNDPENGVRVWCSPRDTYPGTGDPEPFLSMLFSGPRLWVLGVSVVALALVALARLAALRKARVSLAGLVDKAG